MYFEKATKFCEIFNVDLTVTNIRKTNIRWRFHKILWPSQNIWTFRIFSKTYLNFEVVEEFPPAKTGCNLAFGNFAKSPPYIGLKICSNSQIYDGDFAKFCGFLRKLELYAFNIEETTNFYKNVKFIYSEKVTKFERK